MHEPEALGRFRQALYKGIGLGCVALGVVGAVVPGLPTTIFLIGAAYFFARSSPTLYRRVISHPRFGKPVRDFIETGAMTRKAKIRSILSMWCGVGIGSAILWWRGAGLPALVVMLILGLIGSSVMLVLVGTTKNKSN